MSTNVNQSGGIGFMGILAIVFIVLKLTETITWSWWAVTAPLYGPIVLMFIIVILAAIIKSK